MKKRSIWIIALGGGLAAFGISGFISGGSSGGGGWGDASRIEIAIGIGLFIAGMFLRNESR